VLTLISAVPVGRMCKLLYVKMKISQIRPHSVYSGNDGLIKEVRSVVMSIDGKLYVEWCLTEASHPEAWVKRKRYEKINIFAAWATELKATVSNDLKGSVSAPGRKIT
jgi:hypothetical protein